MSPHRVILTGASGFLGRAVYTEFDKHDNWDILGLAHRRAKGKLRKVDLRNRDEVKHVMQEFKPEIIIHTAAEKSVDIVNNQPDEARKINVEATKMLLEEAASVGAWVLFMSTDYVFDGKSQPSIEDSTPNPLNLYGDMKVEGEKLAVANNHGVLRLPILYGQVEYLKESAVTVLFEKVLDTTPCSISDYELRYPTSTHDLAIVIRQLSEKKLEDPKSVSGIYQWENDEKMTKYEMTVAMAELFDLPHGHVKGVQEAIPGAPRPFHVQMTCSRLEALGITQRTPFKEGIKDCISPFLKS